MTRGAAIGALAHARGDELEAWLAAQHARALARGLLARMAHVGAPSEPHIVGGKVQRDRRGRVLGWFVAVPAGSLRRVEARAALRGGA